MTRLSTAVLALAFAAAIFAQSISQPVAQASSCGPNVDIAVGSSGNIIRACELPSGEASASLIGAFEPGFIKDMARLTDGSIMILKDSGQIVRNRNNSTQWFEGAPAVAFFRVSFDNVAVMRQRGQTPLNFKLNDDRSLQTTYAGQESVFPFPCNEVFIHNSNEQYCVDHDNGKIYRSKGLQTRGEATLYYSKPGITFARPYRDGLLVLVRAQYDCGEATQVPASAVFCYFAGSCKPTTRSELLYLVGDKPAFSVVAYDLSLQYASSFAVVGNTAFVAESQIGKDGKWEGDYVSRIDLFTGNKKVWLSVQSFKSLFGITFPNLWIN